MKNLGIVKRGCFVVQIYWYDNRGEGMSFKSWRNAYRWFRHMLSITGTFGGTIIYCDALGHYRRIVCSISGNLIWE